MSTFNVWYLDDGTLGGSLHTILADFNTNLLSWNISKYEVYMEGALSDSFLGKLQSVASGVHLLDSSAVTLLGPNLAAFRP